MKDMYVIQPYHVGSKNAKSLAIVLPARMVKKYRIDTSTIFMIRGIDKTNSVVLHSYQNPGELQE
jgi:hypothetical protein